MTSALPSTLSDFQLVILAHANDGLSNRQIAEQVKRPFACIITTFNNIKRKGYPLPDHRPLDVTAERARVAQERRDQGARPGITNFTPAPRFTAKGVRASTGERFEVTSDDQAHSDEWLAYMVGDRP